MKKLLYMLMMVIVFSAGSAVGQVQNYLASALNKIQAHDYPGAIGACNEALKLDSKSHQAYFLKGKSEHYLQLYNKASKDLSQAIALNSSNDDYFMERGTTYLAQKRYEESAADMNVVLSHKFVRQALVVRAFDYFNLKKFDEADNDYASLIKNHQNDYVSYIYRGSIAAEKDNVPLAKKYFDKAAEIAPASLTNLRLLGKAKLDAKLFDEALADYKHMNQMAPSEAGYFGMAFAYGGLNDNKNALQNYKKAAEISPSSATYNNIGQNLREMGQYKDALEYLEKALDLAPSNRYAIGNRALIYFYQANYEQALTDLDRTILFAPDKELSYEMRGYLYSLLGKYAEAKADIGKVINLAPKSAFGYSSLGYLDILTGNYQDAIQATSKALELEPANSPEKMYNMRGYAYFRLQQYEQAKKDYARAIQVGHKYLPFFDYGSGAADASSIVRLQLSAPISDVNDFSRGTFHPSGEEFQVRVRIIGQDISDSHLQALADGVVIPVNYAKSHKVETLPFLIEGQPVSEHTYFFSAPSKTFTLQFAYGDIKSQPLIIAKN